MAGKCFFCHRGGMTWWPGSKPHPFCWNSCCSCIGQGLRPRKGLLIAWLRVLCFSSAPAACLQGETLHTGGKSLGHMPVELNLEPALSRNSKSNVFCMFFVFGSAKSQCIIYISGGFSGVLVAPLGLLWTCLLPPLPRVLQIPGVPMPLLHLLRNWDSATAGRRAVLTCDGQARRRPYCTNTHPGLWATKLTRPRLDTFYFGLWVLFWCWQPWQSIKVSERNQSRMLSGLSGFLPCPIRRLHCCKDGLVPRVVADPWVTQLSPAGISGAWGTVSLSGLLCRPAMPAA